jgi:hypothetical protein
MEQPSSTSITVTNIDIPFGRLVGILLKVMLAAIPAVIVFYAIFFAIALVVMTVFGGGAALLSHFGNHP